LEMVLLQIYVSNDGHKGTGRSGKEKWKGEPWTVGSRLSKDLKEKEPRRCLGGSRVEVWLILSGIGQKC